MKWACIVLLLGGLGCSGYKSWPLPVSPGQSKSHVETELRSMGLCRKSPADNEKVYYEQCSSPGLTRQHAWAVALFDNGKLKTLQRYERHASVDAGQRRWNDLVVAIQKKYGPPSVEAGNFLRDSALIPEGARSWKAFYDGKNGAVIGGMWTVPDGTSAHVIEVVTENTEWNVDF